jgi:predicted dehydrogenase
VLAVEEIQLGNEQRPLQAELDSFLRAVREGRDPEVTGRDGRRALALADRIAADIRAQRW